MARRRPERMLVRRDAFERLRCAGAYMANFCFNVGQRGGEHGAAMIEMQREWDESLAALRSARDKSRER